MSADLMPLDANAMRLLAEIGFIGTNSGQTAATRALFGALQTLRPDSNLPFIGRALAELAIELPQNAVRILRDEGLKQFPGDAEIMAFLGVALQDAGEGTEANKVLYAALAQQGGSEEPHFRMARKQLSLSMLGKQPAGMMPLWGGPARTSVETTR
jgi:hypothetical protein